MTPSPSTDNKLVRQQLSEGFEHLLYLLAQGQLKPDEEGFHCDVLIIGSGYGGAVAADELSRPAQGQSSSARIWLLERGQAYQPGDFPDRMASLAGHVRVSTPEQDKPRGNRAGLFDVRLGPDMQAVLGNGLGGGSLINAGVMIWPSEEVMQDPRWPEAIRDDQPALHTWRDDLLKALGAQPAPIEPAEHRHLPKHVGLQRLAGPRPFQRLNVTTAQDSGHTEQHVPVRACLHCGDCATGCNHGAKLSLDTTLLASARQQGVQIYTGATALHLERASSGHGHHEGWTVWCHHTDAKLRAEQDQAVGLHARHVIVAAGALGSTELLLRSRAHQGLSTSPLLGQRLSGNGDMILSLYDSPAPMQAMADENDAPIRRQVGPTITGMIDWRSDNAHPFVVQDLAIPGPLQAIFQEYNAISHALCELNETDRTQHGAEERDPSAVDERAMAHTLPLAMIGHDAANGQIELISADLNGGDGAVRIVWPEVKRDPRFEQQLEQLKTAWGLKAEQPRSRLFATPGWQPFPPALSTVLSAPPGPMVTVHPLGGCVMGEDCWSGVVNHAGQVFDGQGEVYSDLAVLDGAIIPTSLGVNPALTIAVIAQRAAVHLKAEWGLARTRQTHTQSQNTAPSEVTLSLPDPYRAPTPQATEIQITEQMRGWSGEYGIELTLRFEPMALKRLWAGHTADRVLQADPAHSHVRIVRAHPTLPKACWDQHEVLMQAPVSGTLAVFQRESSSPLQRQVRGGLAFLWNRGLRDAYLGWREARRHPQPNSSTWRTLLDKARQGWSLASHAGQARRMDYALQIGPVRAGPFQAWSGQVMEGHKRITYGLRSNPWTQLMDMTLTRCPPIAVTLPSTGTVLSLNLDYLADQSVPLLRITRQQSMPDAMMDLSRLGLQVARMMVPIHAWSMRKPEDPKPRVICRLPAAVPGLPPPEITELDVAPPLPDGTPVRLRLTRYRQKPKHSHAQGKPILMLHGYSASGTTFAHHAVDPCLARHLWERGHDVWVADMRTSAGMPTGAQPWRFEDVGYVDIPLAVQHVSQATGGGQINVIAHCMGSAMLWMGLLGDALPEYPATSQIHQVRMDMPRRIHRLAMSQVAPIVVFSPANVLRAYVTQYIQTLLPNGAYRFRSDVNRVSDGADMSMMDRLLMTLPYPNEDFEVENPPWQMWRDTAWVGTRRRMDALYGRDFKLSNISPKLLPYLDDHFGPLSLSTMKQGLHLALNRSIANAQGINTYLNEAKMRAVLSQLNGMMSFHGVDNGLSDIRGLYRFHDYVQRLGSPWSDKYEIHPIADHGHQDCLIGIHAQTKVFGLLDAFFQELA